MTNIIEVNNLSFRYKNKFIFDNLNLAIKEGEWVSIVGPNGSGKTTLAKLLVGLLPSNDSIIVDNLPFNNDNMALVRKRIGIIFTNTSNYFVGETVADEIAFVLENQAYKHNEMESMIHNIATLLEIDKLLDKDPQTLSGGEKQKVALASVLVSDPKILIIDGALEMIDANTKKDIFNLISKLQKELSLTIINLTHDLEETYYADRIIVIKDGCILVDGPTKEVLKEDKVFNRIGLEIPFMVDLSIKLQLYGLIDKLIFDMNEMVDALWQ